MKPRLIFIRIFLPFLFGGLLSFAFSPISLPGFGLISLAWLFYALTKSDTQEQTQTPKEKSDTHNTFSVFRTGWIYGIGVLAVGTSWIYISIHTYGQANVPASLIVTFLFCAFLGLYWAFFAVSFVWVSKIFKENNLWVSNLNFSVLWVIFEYLRAHLFTGFPWLLLGFSQTQTPMKYLAPIMGVYGLSFLVAFSGGLLAIFCTGLRRRSAPRNDERRKRTAFAALILLFLLYSVPQLLSFCHWTKPASGYVPVSIVQGNIGENEKWLPHAYEKTIAHYVALTRKFIENTTKKSSIIVWPEGAIPVPYPISETFLNELSDFIAKHNATLVAGIPYQSTKNEQEYYNAMIVLGKDSGHYFKHHIVPFGEYYPADIIRKAMNWLGVSFYETGRGAYEQPLLNINHIPTLPFICYEIAYADILFKSLPTAQLLITISDDAWFGHSMARAQHLQIAQMRSLQSGRYQIVGTNNGISAILNEKGDVVKTIPSFQTRVLHGSIKAMSGSTPWSKIGDNLIILGLIFLWALVLVVRKLTHVLK